MRLKAVNLEIGGTNILLTFHVYFVQQDVALHDGDSPLPHQSVYNASKRKKRKKGDAGQEGNIHLEKNIQSIF